MVLCCAMTLKYGYGCIIWESDRIKVKPNYFLDFNHRKDYIFKDVTMGKQSNWNWGSDS
jgi:hypothetical protein